MGVLREPGQTVLNLPKLAVPERPKDEFLEAVREAAAGDYEVFGEIGRGADQSIVYLARDMSGTRLAAIKLAPNPARPGEFLLDVIKELDQSVPAFENFCNQCGASLRQWGRFCTKCGADLYGSEGVPWTPEELREAVQDFAGDTYDILGEMRAQGGGRVYFARDKATGKVEALRLQKTGGEEYSLGRTAVLKPIVDAAVGGLPPTPGPAPRPPVASGPPPAPSRTVEPQPPPLPRSQPPRVAGRSPMNAPGTPPTPPRTPAGQPRPLPPEPAGSDPWAPVRDFLTQPVVMAGILLAVILLLAIILALVT